VISPFLNIVRTQILSIKFDFIAKFLNAFRVRIDLITILQKDFFMSDEPNWDYYFNKQSKLSFDEYRAKSPFLSRGGLSPTVYNEDNTWIYLASLDMGVKTDDRKKLEESLKLIEGFYKSKIDSDYKRAQLKVDIDELQDLIYKMDVL